MRLDSTKTSRNLNLTIEFRDMGIWVIPLNFAWDRPNQMELRELRWSLATSEVTCNVIAAQVHQSNRLQVSPQRTFFARSVGLDDAHVVQLCNMLHRSRQLCVSGTPIRVHSVDSLLKSALSSNVYLCPAPQKLPSARWSESFPGMMNQPPALRWRGQPISPKNQTRLPPRFQRWKSQLRPKCLEPREHLDSERKRPITLPMNARQLLAFQQFTAS